MSIHSRLLVVAAFYCLSAVGCGDNSTGHTDDPTPGGEATPGVETMDDGYAEKAAGGAAAPE